MKQEDIKYILENIGKKSVKDISSDLGLKERKVKKLIETKKAGRNKLEPLTPAQGVIKKRTILLSVIVIAILGFAVYANSLGGEFIWDDSHLVEENAHIKSWSNVDKIFKAGIREGAGRKGNAYRPLQMLTYMIDHSLWKLNTLGYHLTSVIIHILTALCIYWFINIVFRDNLISLFTAALFVVHPVHTEAVSYISGRADPLSLFFMLLTFIFYIKNLSSGSISTFIGIAVTYACAILSKESGFILPALILLYHYTFRKKIRIASLFIIIAITVAYSLVRVTLLKPLLSAEAIYPSTLAQRIPGVFVAITNYVRLLFLPLTLHMEYQLILFRFGDPRAIMGAAITFALLAWAFIKRNDNKLIFFSITWFFIALLPVSNLFPINAYMYEHWLYVPSIGFFLILAGGLSYLYRTRSLRMASVGLTAALLVLFSLLTVRQNIYWQESVFFFKRTLRYAPMSARIHNDLGYRYYKVGRTEEAKALFKRAIELDPGYFRAYVNLADAYKTKGEYGDAAVFYKKVTDLIPSPGMYMNLGISYLNIDRKADALEAFKKVVEMEPNNLIAHLNMGDMYNGLGDKEKAILSYEKAISINPDFIGPYINLGNLYVAGADAEKGIAALKRALKIDPKNAIVHNNLAIAYYGIKDYSSAIEHCDRALELGYKVRPDFLEALKPYRK